MKTLRTLIARYSVYIVVISILTLLYIFPLRDLSRTDSLLVLISSLISLAFAVLYGSRSNWHATQVGRALMGLTVAFTIMIMSFAIMHIFSSFRGETTLRYVILSIFIFTEIHITNVLRRNQDDQREYIRFLENKLYDEINKDNGGNSSPGAQNEEPISPNLPIE